MIKKTGTIVFFTIVTLCIQISRATGQNFQQEIILDHSVEPEKPAQWQPPWRGSVFIYRNAVTGRSFDRNADLTYNPYYAMIFTFGPRWWIGDIINIGANLSLTQEITNSDTTTKRGETELSDFTLTLAATNFATIPVLKIDLTGRLGFIFPSSKTSRARTMNMALKPSFGLSRSFDALSGVNLFYDFSFTKYFHDFTTGKFEEPLIPGCSASGGDCDSFLNNGTRNTSVGFLNQFGLAIAFTPKFGISGSVGLAHSVLYKQEDSAEIEGQTQDAEESSEFGDPAQRVRYGMLYNLEANATPIKALTIALGADTANQQLKQNSTYEEPFFNRYTLVYLDLRLNFAGLTESITSSKRSK